MQLHWPSSQTAIRQDFAHYLLRSRFTEDVGEVIDRISRQLAALDGGDPEKIADRLRVPLEEWLRTLIRHDFGAYATLRRHLRARAPWLLAWLKTRHRLAVGWERRNIFIRLRKDGATPAYLEKFRRELAQTEDVLTGREFKQFLGQWQPLLALR